MNEDLQSLLRVLWATPVGLLSGGLGAYLLRSVRQMHVQPPLSEPVHGIGFVRDGAIAGMIVGLVFYGVVQGVQNISSVSWGITIAASFVAGVGWPAIVMKIEKGAPNIGSAITKFVDVVVRRVISEMASTYGGPPVTQGPKKDRK